MFQQCTTACCSRRRMEEEEGPHGLYYRDDFNDMAWSCTIGTTDEHGIWLNRGDPAGTIMCFMVWILLGYSALTITLLAGTGGIPASLSLLYDILCALALAAHVKTTLTDPGSVPPCAVPTEAQRRAEKLSMCSQCQTFKPPFSHHCRICNRCISKMDRKFSWSFMRCLFCLDGCLLLLMSSFMMYTLTDSPRYVLSTIHIFIFHSDHCPWMNNCIGAGNMKHFFLFLIYTWSCSVFSLVLLGWNYFFCASEDCAFTLVLTQLVRIMTVLSCGAFLFTSSMLMNVLYGLLTGIGTIDRLKKKATDTMEASEEEPTPLADIFGIAPFWQWPLPTDPIFDDYDRVMGFSTSQRLLREQILREQDQQPTTTPMILPV